MELNEQERIALELTSEALMKIRVLSRGRIKNETLLAIRDLAEAFHNVPEQIAGSASQREANAFLIEASIKLGREAYLRHGLESHVIKL